MVKNLPAMQETCVRSLGQEDPLETGMASVLSSCEHRMPGQRVKALLAPTAGSVTILSVCLRC